jgi:hypothetical protein
MWWAGPPNRESAEAGQTCHSLFCASAKSLHLFSATCSLLFAQNAASALCFQSIAVSFSKTPGGMVSQSRVFFSSFGVHE